MSALFPLILSSSLKCFIGGESFCICNRLAFSTKWLVGGMNLEDYNRPLLWWWQQCYLFKCFLNQFTRVRCSTSGELAGCILGDRSGHCPSCGYGHALIIYIYITAHYYECCWLLALECAAVSVFAHRQSTPSTLKTIFPLFPVMKFSAVSNQALLYACVVLASWQNPTNLLKLATCNINTFFGWIC